jgi:hypothetical protein
MCGRTVSVRREALLGACMQLRLWNRGSAVVLQKRRVCHTAYRGLFCTLQTVAAVEAETHVVWVIAPAAVALHAARGTSLSVQSQAHNARVVSRSPTRQGIAQFDDELQPDQMCGPKSKNALGAAYAGGIGMCSQQHRPIKQGSADR